MSRLLIVEDNARDLELLLDALGDYGNNAVVQTRGQDALAIFSPQRFGIVMINLALPDMDGLDLIREIRRASTETLIVVITGADDPRRRAQAIDAGASDFFGKPYTLDDHRMIVRQLDAKRAAYSRGKGMRDWRTTIGGSLHALGTAICGIGVVPGLTDVTYAEKFKWVVIAGFIIQALGVFFTGLFAMDKSAASTPPPTP